MRSRAAIHLIIPLCILTLCAALGVLVSGCAILGDSSSDSTTSLNGPVSTEPATGSTHPAGSTDSPSTSRSTTTVTVPRTLPPSPAERILARMTLRQKAAQTLLVTLDGDETLLPGTTQMLEAGPPGGFLLLSRNVAGVAQLTGLTSALQAAAKQVDPGIGLFIAVDQEGGSVQRIHSGVPRVPSARRLAEDSDTADAVQLANETAKGLLALGVNMNLAPVADVVSDTKSFLYSRSYSGDPTVVVDFVKAVSEAYERNGLIAVVKHFPGHGSASGDSHSQVIVSTASQVDFAKIHLRPFKAAIAAGVEGVMIGHLIVKAYDPDHPATVSNKIVDDLLRQGLGFSGLVVTDDIEMAGAAGTAAAGTSATGAASSETARLETLGTIAVEALAAGCNLITCSGSLADQTAVIDAIVEAVGSGRLPAQRLDQAVLGMLDVKLRHGLVSP